MTIVAPDRGLKAIPSVRYVSEPPARDDHLRSGLCRCVHGAEAQAAGAADPLAEHPDLALPTHRNAVAMKAWVRSQFRELTAELARTRPVDDPAALGDQLALVMEGVYASVQALGADGPARQARALVELLLSEA